jgi:hypothetical protein
MFGLLGPNSAGKTTAIRVVTTLLPPNAGTMEVFGLDTRRSTMRVRRLVGYVPQQLSIDGQLTGHYRAHDHRPGDLDDVRYRLAGGRFAAGRYPRVAGGRERDLPLATMPAAGSRAMLPAAASLPEKGRRQRA